MPRRSNAPFLTIWFLFVFFFASCSTQSADPTTTNVSASAAPILPTPTLKPTATATPVPAPARPQYTMNVVLNYAGKSVAVDETILYPNHTGTALSSLLLAVEPNYWQNCFTLESLAVDGTPLTSFTLAVHKLMVPLPAPLPPEAIATLRIEYTLNLPLIEPSNPN